MFPQGSLLSLWTILKDRRLETMAWAFAGSVIGSLSVVATWLLAGLAVLMGAPLLASGDPFAVGLVAATCVGILLMGLRVGPARFLEFSEPTIRHRRMALSPEREVRSAGGKDNPIVLTVIRR